MGDTNNISQGAGTAIFFGTTAANPLIDTYVQIGLVTDIGEIGRIYGELLARPIYEGVVRIPGAPDDGSLTFSALDDLSDAGQIAIDTAFNGNNAKAYWNWKAVRADAVNEASATVTISVAAPGVVTDTAHGFLAGTPVKFTNVGGGLPTGLVSGTTYYVLAPTTDSYNLAATPGGAAITTTGTSTGVHTRTTVPQSSILYLRAKLMSFRFGAITQEGFNTRAFSGGIQPGSINLVRRLPAGNA